MVRKVIEFYLSRIENQYDAVLTNEFIKEHIQKSGGYIARAKYFKGMTKGSKTDRLIKAALDSDANSLVLYQTVKERMSYDQVGEDVNRPEQGWHLLISYIVGSEATKGKEWISNRISSGKAWGDLRCPELMLWMAEIAGCDITEAQKRAVEMCENGRRIQAGKMIRECITWRDIIEKIEMSIKA